MSGQELKGLAEKDVKSAIALDAQGFLMLMGKKYAIRMTRQQMIIIKYDSSYLIVGIDMEKMATEFCAPQYIP